MPVLINQDSGLAENLSDSNALSAAQAGSHLVPLNDPQGNPVSVPYNQFPQLIQQGYSQPNPDQLNSLLKYAKYGTPLEQAKTFGEGVGKGLAGPVFTTGQRLFGVNPEDVRGREEINPITSKVGEATGLIAPALVGEEAPLLGNVLGKAGKAAEAATGLEGATGFARIGSAAVRGAAEMAVLQGSDELSKTLLQDPNQSAETAMINIGLAGLTGAGTGAAFGTVPAMWGYAKGTRLGKMLGAITDRVGGIEGVDASPAAKALTDLGVEAKPEVLGAMEGLGVSQEYWNELMQSRTWAGTQARDAIADMKSKVQEGLLAKLGKTPSDLDALSGMSEYDLGGELKKSLINDVSQITDPAGEAFEKLKAQNGHIVIPPGFTSKLGDAVSQISNENSAQVFDTPQNSFINRVMKGIPKLEGSTLDGLRKAQTEIREWGQSEGLYHLSGQVVKAFRNAEEDLLTDTLKGAGSQIADMAEARAHYRGAMELVDRLGERLPVGKYYGPESFKMALGDLENETLLKRLTPTRDTELLNIMQNLTPNTAELVKNVHLDNLLKAASKGVKGEESINVNNLLKAYDKWSPELRGFTMTPEAQQAVENARTVQTALPPVGNSSNTAGFMDALFGKVPATALSLAAALTGHSPWLMPALYALTNIANREAPNAVKLGLLKLLGKSAPISAEGFKAMTDFIGAFEKSDGLMTRAIGSVLRPNMKFPNISQPSEKTKTQLNEKLDELQKDPSPLLQVGGHVPYYMAEHGSSFGQIASRGTTYLASIKPNTAPLDPLSGPRQPSSSEISNYEKALNVAEQPLTVMASIKTGSLSPIELQTLKTIYPALYDRMSQKLTSAISDLGPKAEALSYKTKLGLSMFLGQNLDSTLSPNAIVANQMALAGSQAQQMASQAKPVKASKTGISKMHSVSMDQTAAQRAADRRGKI